MDALSRAMDVFPRPPGPWLHTGMPKPRQLMCSARQVFVSPRQCPRARREYTSQTANDSQSPGQDNNMSPNQPMTISKERKYLATGELQGRMYRL
eukprot:3351797-Pyramimonas_sp.AAC.2